MIRMNLPTKTAQSRGCAPRFVAAAGEKRRAGVSFMPDLVVPITPKESHAAQGSGTFVTILDHL